MKNARTQAIVALAVTTLWSVDAFAAGAGEGFPWVHWGVSMLNFVIFLGILIWFAGPKVQEFFHQRREVLLADLNEAKRLREEAQEKLDEYSGKLDELDAEREKLRNEYHEAGQREKDRLVAEATKQVEKMRADAEMIIQQETRKAISALERQAVQLAVDMAEEAMKAKLNPLTHNALVDQYVNDLKAMEG